MSLQDISKPPNQEAQFYALRDQFLSASDDRTKMDFAAQIGTGMPELPAVRRWVAEYLSQDGIGFPAITLTFLLMPFQNKPTRDEVAIATKYWRPDIPHELYATTAIILKGREHLSPEEQERYVREAKAYFSVIREDNYNWINHSVSLVKLIGDFEGEKSLDWMLNIVENESSLGPAPAEALYYATKFDRIRAVEALLKNTRKSQPLDENTKKIWNLTPLLYQLDIINRPEDIALIAEVLVEADNLTVKDQGHDMMTEGVAWLSKFSVLRYIVEHEADKIRSLLTKLAQDHPARSTLETLLAEGVREK